MPADACDRLPEGDDRAYVCGQRAFREGRLNDAANLLAALRDPSAYPDVGRALALARGVAVSGAEDPSRDARCAWFGATADECRATAR